MTNPINYNPNSPTVKLSFADWQIQFIQNFTQLNNAFSQNHVPLTDLTSPGNHTFIEMPEQTSNPQTGSQEFSICAKDIPEQTSQVYFVFPSNIPVVQFTNYQIYVVPATDQQTTYFTFLPGGLLVYFGTFGPFNQTGNNILKLNPPIAKNIVSMNFCNKGTTPQYSPFGIPEFKMEPIAGGGNSFNSPAIIKEIYVLASSKASNLIDYFIVVNT